MGSSSEQYLTIGLKVNTQSQGWHESLTKVLKQIKGATYTIDAEEGMALVSGRANSKSILIKLKKSGSDVAWIKTGKPNTYGSCSSSSSSNGYFGIGSENPYLQYPNYHQQYYQQQPNYHYSSYYYEPYVPNPPHFEPYSYWSTRYY